MEVTSFWGYFKYESIGQYLEFSARRVFSKNWCKSTLLKIQKVMSGGESFMMLKEQLSELELTLNSVEGFKASW